MFSSSVTPFAHRLGTSAHISPLLLKARRLGATDMQDLEAIAVSRGLTYFGRNNQPSNPANAPIPAEHQARFSNEELAIALLNPAAPYSMNRIRMAAAVMAGNSISARKITHLARQERCEPIVKYIAECGKIVEPDNPFWQSLLNQLPNQKPANPTPLPHISRFVAMSGINRNGKQTTMQWIRPTA